MRGCGLYLFFGCIELARFLKTKKATLISVGTLIKPNSDCAIALCPGRGEGETTTLYC